MNFALGYAFSAVDLFCKFPFKSLKMKYPKMKKLYKTDHREDLAARILVTSVKLVLKDIVENNTVFRLPFKDRGYIKMLRITGEDFKRHRKMGRFKGIDFLATFFTGYQMILSLHTKGYERIKPIYLSGELKQLLIDKTNSGMQYG